MKKMPFEEFGTKLFSEEVMSEYLPRPIFERWKQSVRKEEAMDKENADAIAHAMKVWAMENGATHFSHWFHPLTGASAEKHDAFLQPSSTGKTITRFSGKYLIKGETDGSSFPNGGLRQTFEARGYTYWDVTSPAFIRGHVLFIPSIFISYNGESLDEKAPLLRAMDALNNAAVRVVNALGDKSVKTVKPMVGLEQEYFLVKKDYYLKRDDLLYTGRTLMGEKAAKGQELEGHYYSAIPSDIVHFMDDVNHELWKLGIYSKVEHNEVAPAQFEIAVHFAEANITVDQNMLAMETIKRVAQKHGYMALLHEKPFAYINGSGKHNNFSLSTDTGLNLFDPGEKPHENIRFIIFVCALLAAVDKHAELLRFAASTAGNDHRLGASEAPPAIISVYLGDIVASLFEQIEHSKVLTLEKELPYFSPLASISETPKDYSDRNRTSPFAFTGNKFEFRMPGSSICSAFVNAVLCTTLAESLMSIADELETFKYVTDARDHALKIAADLIKKHKRIIFNGDGYNENWVKEAEKRGLPNVRNYIDSAKALLKPETVAMFEKTKVLSLREIEARFEVTNSLFVELIDTEALTLISMVNKEIIPAAAKGIGYYADAKTTKYGAKVVKTLETAIDDLSGLTEKLETLLEHNQTIGDKEKRAHDIQYNVRPLFLKIRDICDAVEHILPAELYPLPTYTMMLYK